MNKKTRAVAIVLVAVLVLSLVASMVLPYLAWREKETGSPVSFFFSLLWRRVTIHGTVFSAGASPFLRRDFRQCCLIMMPLRGGQAMTVVYVDSVFCLNTLMDYLLLRCTAVWPAFRQAVASAAGGSAGRRLRGGGVSAGLRVSLGASGQAGGGGGTGADGLWGGAEAPAADTAVSGSVLRLCRLRAGPGAAVGDQSGGQWSLLHSI